MAKSDDKNVEYMLRCFGSFFHAAGNIEWIPSSEDLKKMLTESIYPWTIYGSGRSDADRDKALDLLVDLIRSRAFNGIVERNQ